MDSRIILAGRSPNFAASMGRGLALRAEQNALGQQEALAQLYQTQGPGIAAGDPNAMNALAQMDPGQAQQMRIRQEDQAYQMQDRAQSQANERERLQLAREAARMKGDEYARTLSAEQRAAQAEDIERGLAGAVPLVRAGDEAGYAQWLQSQGLDPAQYPMQQFSSFAASLVGLAEALKPVEGPKPLSADGKFYADQAAGFVPPDATPSGGINIDLGGGSAKQIFEATQASADAARSALMGLNAMKEAEKALLGGAITGFAADSRLAAAKLGALVGVTDPAVIQNTETFRSAIAPQVSAMIKATVGFTQLSNADREFAEKAAGGSIALDQGTMVRLLDIMRRASAAVVDAHQQKLDAVYPPGQGYDRERTLFSIAAPSAGPPDFSTMPEIQKLAEQNGVDPQDIWDAMSEEDRKMFQP